MSMICYHTLQQKASLCVELTLMIDCPSKVAFIMVSRGKGILK